MEITIRVVLVDNEYKVRTTLFNIVELERTYKTSASQLASGMSLEQLGFLAWKAAQAGGHNPPAKLDDFLKSVVNLTVLDGDEKVGPTAGAQ